MHQTEKAVVKSHHHYRLSVGSRQGAEQDWKVELEKMWFCLLLEIKNLSLQNKVLCSLVGTHVSCSVKEMSYLVTHSAKICPKVYRFVLFSVVVNNHMWRMTAGHGACPYFTCKICHILAIWHLKKHKITHSILYWLQAGIKSFWTNNWLKYEYI